jgi:uncharacterized protein YggT (Ycf19 family)
MPKASFLTYWYLNLPSIILAVLIWLLIGRLVLSAILDAGNVVMRVVRAVTYPVVAPVGAITPRIVPPAGVIMCAIAWLFALRIVLFMGALARGVRL